MKPISRRNALGVGGATMAGMALGTGTREAQAWTLPSAEGTEHLPPFSAPPNVKRDLTVGNSAIRLACVDKGLSNRNGNPAEQVAGIREAGFTACEAFHTGWQKMEDSQVRELKAALEQHDVQFYNIHVWMNILGDGADRTHAEYLRALECAEQMGIKCVLVHTGSRGRNAGAPHPENWTAETWKMSVDAMKKLIADSAGSSVNFGVEAINNNNSNSPTAIAKLIEEVGSDRLKVVLDPTNMLHAGVVYRTTELINLCFELFGENILYAHAKDVQWQSMLPGINWVVPNTGVMDYEVYLTHLSRLNYARPLMVEFLRGDEQYQTARANIEEIAARVGVTIHK